MKIYLNISQWLPKSSPYNTLVIQQTGSSYTAALEPVRGAAVPVGALERQFPGSPISTILLEIGDRRFIAGVVDADAAGNETLDSIDFERLEPNRKLWMEALKVSTIKNRGFLILIMPEEREQWSAVQRVAVKTRESLRRGSQDTTNTVSGTISNQTFAPPIAIGDLFQTVP